MELEVTPRLLVSKGISCYWKLSFLNILSRGQHVEGFNFCTKGEADVGLVWGNQRRNHPIGQAGFSFDP